MALGAKRPAATLQKPMSSCDVPLRSCKSAMARDKSLGTNCSKNWPEQKLNRRFHGGSG